jgi:hypothetical protein
MMARMPAYTGFKAKCAKCHGSNVATEWHNGGTIGERTSRGRNWPCQFRVRGEHLCRECRTCGYAWPEALACDTEASDDEPPSPAPDREGLWDSSARP